MMDVGSINVLKLALPDRTMRDYARNQSRAGNVSLFFSKWRLSTEANAV